MNNLGSDNTNRTRTRKLVAVCLAAAVVTTLAGSASAAPRVIEPENLKRGVDAKLTYSDGSTLHTRSGDLVPLPETPDLGVNDVHIAWETNGAVLFKVTRSSDSKDAVARCQVSGKCTRASAWQDMAEPLSFAHTPQY